MPPHRLLRIASLAAILTALASTAAAQEGDPLSLVDDETQVASLAFEATTGDLTLLPASLELQIATTAPSFCEATVLRFVFGCPREPHPFNPIEVQKDAVRLMNYYERNGFPRTFVDYDVTLDAESNQVDVVFEITEGPARLLQEVQFGKPSAPPVAESLAPELRADWAGFAEDVGLDEGQRVSEFSLVELQNRTRQWLRTRGYAFADVAYEQFTDSTGLAATVRLKVTPGPRSTYESVRIEHVDQETDPAISDGVILRELPFSIGETFDARDMVTAQREVFGLGTFQLATVDVEPETPPYDSTVTVVVRVREAPLRVLRAFAGYYTEGGITGRLEATHRNAFGGARQATATIEARTGVLDQSGVVDGLYDRRASLSLRQPYVFYRALSYTVTPSVRQRNDEIERSESAGLTNTLLFTRAPLQTAALNATLQTRRVDAFGTGASGFLDLASVVGDEPLAVTTTAIGSDVTLGFVDDPFNPTSGLILRPSVRSSTPILSDYRYARGGLTATGFVPLGDRTGLTLRASGGAFTTRGETTLDDDVAYVLLRDQYFYGGGATDVRGWAVTLLGPKVINFREREIDLDGGGTRLDTTVTGFAGLGGRAKFAASVQLNLPFLLGEQWGSSVFVDGGRVWAATDLDLERAFGPSPATDRLEEILLEEGGFRFSAGAGIQYLTPIGFVGVALGVKLNPSYLDLRNAEEVFCGSDDVRSPIPGDDGALYCDAGFAEAADNGEAFDFDSVSTSFLRRLQPQITFGQSF